MAVTEVLSKNYSDMNSQSKYLLYGGVFFIGVIFITLIVVVFSKNYDVLFSDLESHDAAMIIAELEKNKIEYKLEDNGRKILVSDDLVHATRLKLVESVPGMSGGVGFEIFDKDDFGTTEFAQKINYQRALQGELARTIMSINKVKFARVHLVLPTSSIFKRQQNESRASITLILKGNRKLSENQVSGIQKLVASSTPGLKPGRVTILDQKGVTLASNETDDHNIVTASAKLHRKQEIEKYLTTKAQTVLNRAFGDAIAFVTIDVAIDFNNITTTRHQVIPSAAKDANVSRKKEIHMRGNKKEKADTSRSTVEVDYALSKEVEEIISTPGSIDRLSIAIVTPKGLTADQNDYVKTMVANAVGFDLGRGDQIAIASTIDKLVPDMTSHEDISDTRLSPQGIITSTNGTEHYNNDYMNWVAAKMQILISMVTASPVVTFVLLMASILLFLTLVMKTYIRRPIKVGNLEQETHISDEEKNKLLTDIKDWMTTASK